MSDKYIEVYAMLSGMDILDVQMYQQFISKYGEKVVGMVIEDLVEENPENYYRYGVYYSLKTNVLDKSCYSIYSSDLASLPVFDTNKNLEHLTKIAPILRELNCLLKTMGSEDLQLEGRRIPWLDDKVSYCLEHCKDSLLLHKLNDLYCQYLSVRQVIVEGNLRLVLSIAFDYKPSGMVSIEDIIQYGNMGLMRAVEKYDVAKGASFSNYARYWIRASISRNIGNIMYPVKIPSDLICERYRIFRTMDDLSVQLGRDVTNGDLSRYVNRSVDEIKQIMAIFLPSVSLDELFGLENDLENESGKFDIAFQEFISTGDYSLDDLILKKELKDKFLSILESSKLNERQLFVIEHYFGFVGKVYEEPQIAHILGVSTQRVSQLKNVALQKIKKHVPVLDGRVDEDNL